MELNISEIRIIIDALRFRLSCLEDEQTGLDDSEEDRISELSGDIYRLEMLIGALTDDYKERVSEISEAYFCENEKPLSIAM